MKLWCAAVRGLGLVGLVLGGMRFRRCDRVRSRRPTRVRRKPSSSIVVEGNRRVEAETIRSYFRPGPGGRLDAAKHRRGAQGALRAPACSRTCASRQSGGRLVVTVVENPVINRVAFEGNKKLKDDQLASEVQSKPRGTLSRPTVQADVQRIVEIYRRSGRFDVTRRPEDHRAAEQPRRSRVRDQRRRQDRRQEDRSSSATRPTRRRPPARTRSRPPRAIPLFGFLQSQRHLRSGPHRGRPRPAPPLLPQERLCRRPHRLGGRRSTIREQKGFIVTFTIDEGERYRFGKVDVHVERARRRSEHALRAGCRRQRRRRLQRRGRREVGREHDDRGRPARLSLRGGAPARRPRPRRPRTINIAFVVEEGPRVYIERINIRGNTRTRDYVIRREFDIGEGDAYNRALIDRAERRLKNLDYFKTVKITNEPGSAPDRIVRQRRRRRAADRRVLDRRRLFDRRRLHRPKSASPSATCSAAASIAKACGAVRPARARLRAVVRRAVSSSATACASASTCSPSRRWRRTTISYDSKTIGGGTARRLRADRGAVAPAALHHLPAGNHAAELAQQLYSTRPMRFDQRRYRAYPAVPSRGDLPCCYADGEASLAVRKELAAGAGARVAGRLHRRLQHARQQPQPDQRPLSPSSSRTSPASAAT